jgi:hypothetical protein
MSPAEIAVARSVLYASLFDYPLTLAQLRQTLVESSQTPTEILATCARSEALQKVIEQRDGFFFPRGRSDLIAERRRREAYSGQFLGRHRRFLRLACAMPYVRMAALSGSIAHRNLEGTGDLDLFIVTKGRHVWSVAVFVVLLAKLLGCRRAVCANFILADSALALDQPDLFTASQIIHLKPLIGGSVYRRFLAANPFVARFYPNFHVPATDGAVRSLGTGTLAAKRIAEVLLAVPSIVIERVCHLSYRAYLCRRAAQWQSPEQVRLEAECLKLHTQSHRQSVLARFDRMLEQLD